MKRRDFFQSSFAAAAAGAMTLANPVNAAPNKAMIQRYRQLGKTNLKISDISFGAGKLPSSAMILRAIDRGMNYFDTAPDYGSSETLIGDALRRVKQRDKIYIASKFCHSMPYKAGVSHIPFGSSKQDYISAVESSLKRLATDYLDVVFVHAIGENDDLTAEKNRLLDDNMLAATETLKQSGKIRYLAVSSHGPYNLETLLTTAVQSGHYDIIMSAFNFLKYPKIPQLLNAAAQHNVGVIAMKTLAGAKDSGIEINGQSFEHAAFKWVLQHPQVAGLVITIKSVRDLNAYVPASGIAFTDADKAVLQHYTTQFSNDYCRTGCSQCEPCQHNVPIASILRYQMYFENYGEEQRAMRAYAALTTNAEACLTCEDAACASACPFGLNIKHKLSAAHATLSMHATT